MTELPGLAVALTGALLAAVFPVMNLSVMSVIVGGSLSAATVSTKASTAICVPSPVGTAGSPMQPRPT